MFNIVALPGDGVGREVTTEAVRVLYEVGKKFKLDFQITEGLVGGASLDKYGTPIKDDLLEECKNANAVLLGAIGGPKWDDYPLEKRPEKGLLRLRKEMQVYSNLRPVKIYDCLNSSSTLKPEILSGVDLLIVRELTGGLYFGEPKKIEEYEDQERAVDTMEYFSSEIERIADAAFIAAQIRRKKVTSVDKANILATSQLWRRIVEKTAENYPDISLEHMLVDNCAMQLIRYPGQFDVILTENTFGDILSDEASMLSGSLGMLPSASLGNKTGLYEPVHGSAPDIAGKNSANPIGAISSASLMLRYSFKQENAADLIDNTVEKVLAEGNRTKDIFKEGDILTATSEMGDKIIEKIRSE